MRTTKCNNLWMLNCAVGDADKDRELKYAQSPYDENQVSHREHPRPQGRGGVGGRSEIWEQNYK